MPAGAFGHADHGVGQEAAVVLVEPGVDEGVDGLGDGVLDLAHRPRQLGVVGDVAAEEQVEGVGVGHHQVEVGGEAPLDLLAGPAGGGDRLADGLEHGGGDTESTSSRYRARLESKCW